MKNGGCGNKVAHFLAPYLRQDRFPTLWYLFQYFLGGTITKRRLVTKYYTEQKKVLEVGCSLGNISSVFTKYPRIEFLGIDVDDLVVSKARKRFKHLPNFDFQKIDLRELSTKHKTFDYILFASVLEHVNDQNVTEFLVSADKILSKDGIIVIVNPMPARMNDNFLVKISANILEQGEYLREINELEKIINDAKIFTIKILETELVPPFIFSYPKSNRCITIVLTRK